MNIALISFEYPPDSAYGGIATYVRQAARMLVARGHHVEVFTSSPCRSGIADDNGIRVQRIFEWRHSNFPAAIAPYFEQRHEAIVFDVLESPEYGADALEAVRRVPDIPLVVKLHTPSFLVTLATYNGLRVTDLLRWRLFAGRLLEYATQLIRGSQPVWHFTHKYALDTERAIALAADEVASPSKSLAAIVNAAWRLDLEKISHVPYPYVPSEALLALEPGGTHGVVTYIGRLEVRKGVLDLARAIPLALERHPRTLFRFVGPNDESPRSGLGMREYLERKLKSYRSCIEFLAPVSNEQLPAILAETDIVVLPSVWENFANTCLESMAAARAVIASEAGGMAEMLTPDQTGRLVPSCDPQSLARAIVELLDAPEVCWAMGVCARRRLLAEYNVDRISVLQEQSYRRAIERRRALGARAI